MKLNKNISFLVLTLLALASCLPPAQAENKGQEKAALSAKKSNFAGSYLSGQFARDRGDIGSAVYYLQRVYKENTDDIAIARQLQGMLLLQGKIDEAVALAADIKRSGKKDVLSNLLLSLKSIKHGKADEAQQALNNSSDVGKVQLWEPLISAWIKLENGKIDKPVKSETLKIDVGRIVPLVNYHLALINSEAGFIEEAAMNFTKAVENPKDPPERVMAQLLTFYEANNRPASLKPVVDQFLEANPGHDKISQPIVSGMRDGVAEVLYTMGGIMLGAGMSNDAAIYQQLALYIKPDFEESTLILADAYSDLQQHELANVAYSKIEPQSQYYKRAQMRVAINYDRSSNLDKALDVLDALNKRYPDDLEIMVTKGDLLRIHSKFSEAIDAYSQALSQVKEMKTSYWPVLFARGSCYERVGKWELAEVDLKKALELKPDQPDVLNYLGYGWLERGMHRDQAHEMIVKAFKARPDDAEIVDSMGWALYLQGDYANATPYLEKAVELLPGDPTVNDHLGDVYWRIGRKTEARFQWERSLTFSPDEELTNRLQQKLKEGLPEIDERSATTSVSSNQAQLPANNSTQ
jgi:tetratricopeptide (TPR) repeat protein